MKFSEFAVYIEQIEKASSRLTMTELLAELFKKLNKEEIEKSVYLLQGRLAPLFNPLEFGMAEKMVSKSVVMALCLDNKYFKQKYKSVGDIGITTEYFKKEARALDEKDLSILAVYKKLYEMASAAKEGSQEVKIKILADLIRMLDPLSCRYLVRIPIGVMRLGFSDMTVLDAYSWMLTANKSLRSEIEKAYQVRPDLGLIGVLLKEKGVKGLNKINPEVFTPILMMKAERLSSANEIIDKLGKCLIEPKYDGFRLQVHYSTKGRKPEVKLYSRNLEEVSYMYPDIIEGVKTEIKADEVIFEGEAIGFNPNSGSFLPFQETVQRKRKYGIEEKAREIPLKVFAFELLYFNGKSYLDIPFIERRKKLTELIKSAKGKSKNIITTSPDEITQDEEKLELMFDKEVSEGLEGIIAKKLDGVYKPGAREWNWIKYKRSYSGKIDDTIDCLVMGYDYGKGKRTDFGLGAFLVGIFDKNKDKFLTICKIGTGLTDEEWRELQVKSQKLKVKNKPTLYEVDKMMECDVWLAPSIVVEIKADEITKSSVHTAGRTLKSSKSGKAKEVDNPGYALRFPRLENFRDDKRPEDATTLNEVEKMYKIQEKK
ncbi:hypothetical protein A2774_04675 [Candidatus Roizmanbacteria bacterium RIFCSPHIGHO2_01_FULL_39_12c]|uniref:Probable DNA ligase n=1 Tax=Candidatus Roizmanbacteria bacterium RIFCSPHIGHO2_01_FULL_39_12c TaxID=1802031 RepID=A0A1F7GBF0_9BACT|nr:MAG: hypothetical protein A2774_04675 [Candidatus Roizmanbacteria bacterium RIFCSPHIGHO2_01_FULL_39_12c]